MPTCEYCGEEFPKGGAHATHVRYCADRPDSEATAEDEEAERVGSDDVVSHDSSGGTTTTEIGTEKSESNPSEPRATPPQRESEEGAVASETSENTDADVSDGEPGFESEYANVSGQSSHRLLAVVILALFLVVVWILLRGGDDADET